MSERIWVAEYLEPPKDWEADAIYPSRQKADGDAQDIVRNCMADDADYRVRQWMPVGERAAIVKDFADAILHGDDKHRAWLINAVARFLAGVPIEPPAEKARKAVR